MKKINHMILVLLAMVLIISCGKGSKNLEENPIQNQISSVEIDEESDDQGREAGKIEIPGGNMEDEEKDEDNKEEQDYEEELSKSLEEINNSRWSWFVEPGEYLDIILYDEDLIAVADSSGKYGFIDGDKNLITECQYQSVFGVSEKIARAVDFEGNYLFLNQSGKLITKEGFSDANDFSEGFAAVKKNEKWGFLNTSGKMAVACQFDVATEFHEGLAAVKTGENWYYIDQAGKTVFQEEYEDALHFSEGMAAVKKDGKWGFIDKSGNLKIDFQYEDAGNFSEGKAAVADAVEGCREWAYINTEKENFVLSNTKI